MRISAVFCPAAVSAALIWEFPCQKPFLGRFAYFHSFSLSSFRRSGLDRSAALAQILRAADQFRPETLPAIVLTAAVEMVELPSSRGRIDEETPEQFVSLG